MKFTITGQDAVIAEINSVLRGIKDRKLMQELANVVQQDIKNRIKVTKTTPDNIPWAPWSASTLRARTKKGNASTGLLFDSGKLFNSIKATSGIQTFSVGTDVKYAPYLNNGTNKMVARRFMGISPQAKESMLALIETKLGLKKQ